MKLHEVTTVVETIVENKVEPITKLLETSLNDFDLKPITLQNLIVTQHYNLNGNYTIVGRVLLEHSGILLNDERDSLLDKFVSHFEAEFLALVQSNVKGTLRSTTNKLI